MGFRITIVDLLRLAATIDGAANRLSGASAANRSNGSATPDAGKHGVRPTPGLNPGFKTTEAEARTAEHWLAENGKLAADLRDYAARLRRVAAEYELGDDWAAAQFRAI